MTGRQRVVAWRPAVLIVVLVVGLLRAWPTLPDSVAVRFSADGNVATGETSKPLFALQSVAALAMPVLSLPLLMSLYPPRTRAHLLVAHALGYGLAAGTWWVLWAIVRHNQEIAAPPALTAAVMVMLMAGLAGMALGALSAGPRTS